MGYDGEARVCLPSISTSIRNGRERGWEIYREAFDIMCDRKALYMSAAGKVARKIIALYEHRELSDLHCRHPSAMPHDQVIRTIELFGEKVAPLVREGIKKIDAERNQ